MDNPDFYQRFHKEIFETYNDYIFNNYVFFDNVEDLVPKIDTQITATVYNAANGPIVKYLASSQEEKTDDPIKAIIPAVVVLVIGLAATVLITNKLKYR